MALNIKFDLDLSNKIYKENLKSLLAISKDNLLLIANQNIEHFIDNIENKEQTEWFDKSSHLANIEWLLLNSVFTSFFSFFEYHLFALVKVVEELGNYKIMLDDISGKGITKTSNYLHLVADIKSADRALDEWQQIAKFQKVRNLIVHNGGIMVKDLTKKLTEHELYKFLKTNNVIMAGKLGHIRIRETKILELFLDQTFFISDKLVAEINKKYRPSRKSCR